MGGVARGEDGEEGVEGRGTFHGLSSGSNPSWLIIETIPNSASQPCDSFLSGEWRVTNC